MNANWRYLFFDWYDAWQSERIDSILQTDIELANDFEMLRRRVIQQERKIEELATIAAVLSRMLAEAGQVDPKILEYRIEAALEERRAPPPPPLQSSAKCVLCGADRLGNEVSMTAYGTVCHPRCGV